jgi:hypothetical protein
MLPQNRYAYCNQQFSSISSGSGAAFLSQFGLSFVQNSNNAKICANPMPRMSVGDNRIIQPKANVSVAIRNLIIFRSRALGMKK